MATATLQRARWTLRWFAHVARTKMIDSSLEFANYLERVEANAIRRAAQEKWGDQSHVLRAPLPAPTFPDPRLVGTSRCWHAAPTPLEPSQPNRPSLGPSEDDFDNAPTAVLDRVSP